MTSFEDLARGSQRVLEHLHASHVNGRGFADTGELALATHLDVAEVAACCRRLQGIGHVALMAHRGGDEMLVRITEAGMLAAERRHSPAPPSGVTQNFHAPVGMLNMQTGNHNTITPHQQLGGTVQEVAQLLAQLRALVVTLPEEDQEEAAITIESLGKGVQGGRLARAGRAVETLGKLGASSATFVTSLKTISQALGLPFPGADS